VLNFISELVKPLEGGPARKLPEQKLPENTATVLYVSRIPHGFYEKEMEGAHGFFFVRSFLRFLWSVFTIAFCRLFWTIWNHQEVESREK